MTISSVNFTGTYQFDANQQMTSVRDNVKRDNLVIYWSDFATDGFQKRNDFEKQINSVRDNEYIMEFEIPDKYNGFFEESFNSVGQKFNKIG